MKIFCISDLHIGKWDGFGEKVLENAKDYLSHNPVDVVYFGGDMAEPGEKSLRSNLQKGIELLAKLPVKHKLWVAGNNDLELFETALMPERNKMWRHSSRIVTLDRLLSQYDINLLDHNLYTIGNTAFIGNVGWYDGSLWKPISSSDEYPSDATRVEERAHKHWLSLCIENNKWKAQDLHSACMKQLQLQILSCNTFEKIVVCTHFVPSAESVLYGANPKFDYLNYFMGFDANSNSYGDLYNATNIVKGFCGHTHRRVQFKVRNVSVDNVSGTRLEEQGSIHEV